MAVAVEVDLQGGLLGPGEGPGQVAGATQEVIDPGGEHGIVDHLGRDLGSHISRVRHGVHASLEWRVREKRRSRYTRRVAEHVIALDRPTHSTWDVRNEAVVRIRPGDVVHAETLDYSGGQIGRDSTANLLMRTDPARTYPLAGPVLVEGAEPGDALRVEVLALEPAA